MCGLTSSLANFTKVSLVTLKPFIQPVQQRPDAVLFVLQLHGQMLPLSGGLFSTLNAFRRLRSESVGPLVAPARQAAPRLAALAALLLTAGAPLAPVTALVSTHRRRVDYYFLMEAANPLIRTLLLKMDGIHI
jgi:hypothetical protein